MHLVFINQYFPPDEAPTGLMLERVVEACLEQGCEVTVLTSQGGYAETQNTIAEQEQVNYRVCRIGASKFGRRSTLAKLSDYASFYMGVAVALSRIENKPDCIIALTTPPYLSLLARALSKKHKCEHGHWVMDLYPDVMKAHGIFSPKNVFYRMLSSLSKWGFGGSRCRSVVTLGPDMEDSVQKYTESDVSHVPLWSTAESQADETKVRGIRKERAWEDQTVFLYSGNMGLGHYIKEFTNAVSKFSAEEQFRLAFYGGGKRRVEIENLLTEKEIERVELGDYVPRADLSAHLASADVHLASLRPTWDGCMVPSKLQGIFVIGKPVLFLGSGESSIGRWILESGGGWLVAPDKPEELFAAMKEALMPEERKRRGLAAKAYAEEHFSVVKNANMVAEYFTKSDEQFF